MKRITVITPTYNRAYIIDKLYASLLAQTCKEFKWIIVDDGSADDTRTRIESYINEGKIEIEYIYQNNSGKYVAHNTAVKKCTTDLVVCVDSDDELYPDAIEKTLLFWNKYIANNSVAGIVSPKDMNGGSYFTQPPELSSLMDLYNNHQLVGETMLVFRTSVLKKFLFPEINGERFMSEAVVYNQIDKEYVLAVQNDYLYKAEYQADGLTNNIQRIHWHNPKSTLLMYKSEAAFQANNIKAIKAYACYLAWKKARELKPVDEYAVPFFRRLLGYMIMLHYVRLFKKQGAKFK